MDLMYLQEAFKELDALNEEAFNLTLQGMDEPKEFLDAQADVADVVDVIDPEAETEEDLKDSYVGKVIADCCICHSKIYKDPSEVTIDEESGLANVEQECPFCACTDGFKIIGQVAPFENEMKYEEPKTETEEEPVEVEKTEEEVVDESLTAAAAATFVVSHWDEILKGLKDLGVAADEIDDILVRIKNRHKDNGVEGSKNESLKSDVQVTFACEECGKTWTEKFNKNNFKNEDALKLTLDDLSDSEIECPNCGSDAMVSGYKFIESLTEEKCPICGDDVDEPCEDCKDKMKDEVIGESYSKEYLEGQIRFCKKVLNDPYGLEAGDAKANYGKSYKVMIKKDLDRFQKLLDDYKSVEESKSVTEELHEVEVKADGQKVEVKPDGDNLQINIEKCEGCTEAQEEPSEVIAPTDNEIKSEIEANTEEETPVSDSEIDFDLEDFDEESFNKLGENFLKKTYDNVDSYKASNVTSKGNTLTVEGVIKFASGKEKNTTFVFESKSATKSGRARFIGENIQIAKGKKAFSLNGQISEKKFIPESFNYNYRTKNSNGESCRIYGTVTNK